MAAISLSFGMHSCCRNSSITQAWQFQPSGFIGNSKLKPGSDTLIATRKYFSQELTMNPVQNYRNCKLNKNGVAKVSVELTGQVSTGIQADKLEKVMSYSFRTKSGALVNVKVENRTETYAIKIYVSSLQLSCEDSRLLMVWGVYRSDSSCFLPLDFQNSAQDSQIQTIETPFEKSSLTNFTLGLEFDGKEFPFYLSFLLKSISRQDPNGQEIRSHRGMKFCVPVGLSAGHPWPLGLSNGKHDSLNFAIVSRHSEGVVLCFYDDTTTDRPALELDLDPCINRTGDVWHASIENTWNFVSYGYHFKAFVHQKGVNVKTKEILLDPHAKVIMKLLSEKYIGRLTKEPAFDWGEDVCLNIAMEKLVVYRLNVKRFTQHKSSMLPTNVAGTFSGLAEKVNHFKSLGINAVLLEPIFSFSEQQGHYFPFHFFSPMETHGPSAGPESGIRSLKEMVKKLHSHGIEVLLEVVFTHTANSGALRGIDDSSYYYKGRLMDLDSKNYLNCNHPLVQQLVLESLRYWVTEYHIDGFCFINASSLLKGIHGEHVARPPLVEAIAFDPVLSKTKLSADCWDPHDLMPKEIHFPHWKRWAEVNTRFCRNVRNFLRGEGPLSDLATRLCGSGDIFTDGRGPAFSFNFIARNSGLSLVDLVSFSGPELASELSWNCGEEGPTNKSDVLERRLRQIRNFLFIQYISLGVPILNMGDECGLSAGGSPLYKSRKPFDWSMLSSAFGVQITQFIAFMTSLRTRRSDVLQRRNFLKPENIKWYATDGLTPKWEDPASKFLGMALKAEAEEENLILIEQTQQKGDLYIAFNAGNQSDNVVLPSPVEGRQWWRLVDSALPFPGFFSDEGEVVAEQIDGLFVYEMKPNSCTLFETRNSNG